METVICKALVAFTHFLPGYGQVHGDPESSDERARNPRVPAPLVAQLAHEGRVEAPDADDAPVDTFAMEHIGFGKYRLTGPGIDADTIVKGKKDAETALAIARANHAAAPASDDSDDAPVE